MWQMTIHGVQIGDNVGHLTSRLARHQRGYRYHGKYRAPGGEQLINSGADRNR